MVAPAGESLNRPLVWCRKVESAKGDRATPQG